MGSRVELYAAIRFDWQRNQMSIRALADKYGVHRRTVREAVESPVPPPRRTSPRRALVLDSVRELIDAMLVEDLAAPRKQRHTAKRICERLRAEHDARGVVLLRREVRAPPPPAGGCAGGGARRRPGGGGGRVRAAVPPARGGGRGRLRRSVGAPGRGDDQVLPVHAAAVALGARGAPGVRLPGAGGVPGRPRGRVRGVRRHPVRQDPLRQPALGGAPGAVRAQPRGVRALVDVSGRTTGSTRSTASPRRRGRAREGWGRGRRGPVPPHPSGPGAAGRHARRAQRAAGRRRPGRGRPTHRRPRGVGGRRRSPARRRCCCRCPASGSTRRCR